MGGYLSFSKSLSSGVANYGVSQGTPKNTRLVWFGKGSTELPVVGLEYKSQT